MKTLKYNCGERKFSKAEGIEILSISEMYQIRGGNEGEPTKTKEVDIYDTRED